MAYGSNPYGGFSAYREIGVKTASQGKLVVMLYDGAVSNLEKAIALISEDEKIAPGSIENFGKKAEDGKLWDHKCSKRRTASSRTWL